MVTLGAGATQVGVASGLFNVRDAQFGAKGDGTTDDTAAIQAAIAAAENVSGVVYLPRGLYKLTAALSISATIEVVGESLLPIYGSINTNFHTIDMPVTAPFMKGAVLLQTAAATNGITISGRGLSTQMSNFGVRFGDAIRFSNTGHGIAYVPPTVTSQSYLDNGLMASRWTNVMVFGHDGNHYGFYLTNSLYCTLVHLRSFGGGGLFMENNGNPSGATAQFYGNTHVDHFYGQGFLAGSADGIRLKNTTGLLNLILLTRPQFSMTDKTATFAGTTAPTSGQKMINIDSGIKSYAIIAPDFETNVNSGVGLPDAGGSQFISPGGILNFGVGGTGYTMMSNNTGSLKKSNDFVLQTPQGIPSTVTLENVVGVGQDLKIGTDANRVLTLPGAAKLAAYATGGRPSAATVGAGANIYDTTLGKPVWSDGTNWKDATGTTV
jgi:hypothetical protein